MNPKISILLPVYNAEKFVSGTIQSMLNQTFSDFEFIIINDCSTDRSLQIINDFKDERIRVVSNEVNLGLTKTLNIGLNLCNGEYIARMDADDISMPDRLQIQVDYLEKHPEIDIVSGNYEIFGSHSEIVKVPLNEEYLKLDLFFQNSICHPAVMMRKDSLSKFDLSYDTKYLHTEDWALWFNCITKGLRIKNIDHILIKYRLEGQNITVQNRDSFELRSTENYKAILKTLFNDPIENKIKLHFSVSRGIIGHFTISETLHYINNLKHALYAYGFSKQVVLEYLNKKKEILFFRYTDQSFFNGLQFMMKARIFNSKLLKYLGSKMLSR